MSEGSAIGASLMEREDLQQKQQVSDVHIGVFFEGSDYNMVNEVVKGTLKDIDSPFYEDANEIKRLQQLKSAYSIVQYLDYGEYMKKNVESINERLIDYSTTPDIDAGLLCSVEGKGGMSDAFTNVSLLYSIFTGIDNENAVYHRFYIEGCGIGDLTTGATLFNIPAVATGTGSEGIVDKVENAINYAAKFVGSLSNVRPGNTEIHFYVFGFSRGAACARLFCHLLAGGEPGDGARLSPYAADNLNKLNAYTGSQDYAVGFLGLYDTVSAMNLDSSDDVDKYSLYTDKDKIKSICHLCAMDEFRKLYPLIDIGDAVPSNGVEVMIPGCHADVGGGYVDGKEISSALKNMKYKLNGGDFFKTPDVKDCYEIGYDGFMQSGWAIDMSNVSPVRANFRGMSLIVGYALTKKTSRGYSDLPLAMMRDYCHSSTGQAIFSDIPEERNFRHSADSKLLVIGKNIYSAFFGLAKGKRYCLRPNDDDYKYLRSKYLHFSSDDSFNFDQHSLFGSNSPDYNSDFVISRRVYHGVKGKGSSAHFVYELSGEEITSGNSLAAASARALLKRKS